MVTRVGRSSTVSVAKLASARRRPRSPVCALAIVTTRVNSRMRLLVLSSVLPGLYIPLFCLRRLHKQLTCLCHSPPTSFPTFLCSYNLILYVYLIFLCFLNLHRCGASTRLRPHVESLSWGFSPFIHPLAVNLNCDFQENKFLIIFYLAVEGWIIFVRNLNEETLEQDILDKFAKFGPIKNVSMVLDRRSGYAKVFSNLFILTLSDVFLGLCRIRPSFSLL